jgi:hypothetical protein
MHGGDNGQRLWRQWLQEGRTLWIISSDQEAEGFKDVRLDPVGSGLSVGDEKVMLFRRHAPLVAAETQSHGAESHSILGQ